VLGTLLYLSTCTQPDLAYAVGMLARFMAKPRQEHWTRVKGVLQYLRRRANCGLMFVRGELKLEGSCGSDLAADPAKWRSTSGCVFLLADGAISFQAAADSSDVNAVGGVPGKRLGRKGGAMDAQADG
jgi:hypothetical protein